MYCLLRLGESILRESFVEPGIGIAWVKLQGFVKAEDGLFVTAQMGETDPFVAPFPSLEFLRLRRNDHFPGLMLKQRLQVVPYLFEGLVSLLRGLLQTALDDGQQR